MADFVIKRGDTRPVVAAQLTDNDLPIDLTAATTVKFLMRQQGGQTVIVNANCTFVNRANGQVLYTWTTPDTVSVGVFDVEFQITWADGGVETVPNDIPAGHAGPYYTVEVKQDLA